MNARGLIYTIENILCFTEIDKISKVIQEDVLTPMPLTKEWLVGVIQLRGNIVPITDILKFSIQKTSHVGPEHHKKNILIIQEDEWFYGIKVNQLMGIHVIESEIQQASTLPPELVGISDIIAGMYDTPDGYLYNLNLHALLGNNTFMHPEL